MLKPHKFRGKHPQYAGGYLKILECDQNAEHGQVMENQQEYQAQPHKPLQMPLPPQSAQQAFLQRTSLPSVSRRTAQVYSAGRPYFRRKAPEQRPPPFLPVLQEYFRLEILIVQSARFLVFSIPESFIPHK